VSNDKRYDELARKYAGFFVIEVLAIDYSLEMGVQGATRIYK
jgi:hypothetical protein